MIHWIVHSILLIGLAMLISRKWNSCFHPSIFFIALSLKLFAGLALGYIFLYYYGGGDTWIFFRQAKQLTTLPLKDYFDVLFSTSNYDVSDKPRVLFFCKFLSFFVFLTGGSYWITSLYLSFVSFCAYWYISNIVSSRYPDTRYLAVTFFLLMPSVVFWSSGILKGTLANAAVVTLVAIHLDAKRSLNPKLIIALISLFILFKIKHYLLISIILFFGIFVSVKLLIKTKGLIRFTSIIVLLIASFLTQFIHPYLRIERLSQTLHENNQAIITITDPEDQIGIEMKSSSWQDVIKVLPIALHTGLLRPSLMDTTPIWGWIHKLENTLLSLLIILSFLLLYKLKPPIDIPLITAAVVSILLLASMLALSTPNFGTLVRYKNAFIPFLFLISSILPHHYLSKGLNNK